VVGLNPTIIVFGDAGKSFLPQYITHARDSPSIASKYIMGVMYVYIISNVYRQQVVRI